MGALADLRADLKAALTGKVQVGEGALQVFDLLPDVFLPPAIVLEQSDPFLTPNSKLPARYADAHWDVLLIIGQGLNEAQALGVEELVEQTLDAVYALDGNLWLLAACSGPLVLTRPNGTFLAVRVTVTRPAQITTT